MRRYKSVLLRSRIGFKKNWKRQSWRTLRDSRLSRWRRWSETWNIVSKSTRNVREGETEGRLYSPFTTSSLPDAAGTGTGAVVGWNRCCGYREKHIIPNVASAKKLKVGLGWIQSMPPNPLNRAKCTQYQYFAAVIPILWPQSTWKPPGWRKDCRFCSEERFTISSFVSRKPYKSRNITVLLVKRCWTKR